MRRTAAIVIGLTVLVGSLTACLTVPASTSGITLVSSSTVGGWRYDFYRNSAYPCSISGDQTFSVGTKVGSSPSATSPLWVWLHGGGVGYFDPSGTPQPDGTQMTENSATSLRGSLSGAGLVADIRADAAGFRTLAVSYCNRDIYSGTGQTDPNNPNPNSDGSARATNGLQATRAAIDFVQAHYPTSTYVLGGGSAGSAGAYYVAWAQEVAGNPPAGVVGDASVVNVEVGEAAYQQGACVQAKYDPQSTAIIAQRIDPQLADPANEVDRLVASGRLTVPLLQIWNHGDVNTCGSTPMQCPLRDGSVVTLGVTDCYHQPLAAAITAEGPTSRSENLPVCVQLAGQPPCSLHVVTPHSGLVNSDPSTPADYVGAAMTWIDQRLADR